MKLCAIVLMMLQVINLGLPGQVGAAQPQVTSTAQLSGFWHGDQISSSLAARSANLESLSHFDRFPSSSETLETNLTRIAANQIRKRLSRGILMKQLIHASLWPVKNGLSKRLSETLKIFEQSCRNITTSCRNILAAAWQRTINLKADGRTSWPSFASPTTLIGLLLLDAGITAFSGQLGGDKSQTGFILMAGSWLGSGGGLGEDIYNFVREKTPVVLRQVMGRLPYGWRRLLYDTFHLRISKGGSWHMLEAGERDGREPHFSAGGDDEMPDASGFDPGELSAILASASGEAGAEEIRLEKLFRVILSVDFPVTLLKRSEVFQGVLLYLKKAKEMFPGFTEHIDQLLQLLNQAETTENIARLDWQLTQYALLTGELQGEIEEYIRDLLETMVDFQLPKSERWEIMRFLISKKLRWYRHMIARKGDEFTGGNLFEGSTNPATRVMERIVELAFYLEGLRSEESHAFVSESTERLDAPFFPIQLGDDVYLLTQVASRWVGSHPRWTLFHIFDESEKIRGIKNIKAKIMQAAYSGDMMIGLPGIPKAQALKAFSEILSATGLVLDAAQYWRCADSILRWTTNEEPYSQVGDGWEVLNRRFSEETGLAVRVTGLAEWREDFKRIRQLKSDMARKPISTLNPASYPDILNSAFLINEDDAVVQHIMRLQGSGWGLDNEGNAWGVTAIPGGYGVIDDTLAVAQRNLLRMRFRQLTEGQRAERREAVASLLSEDEIGILIAYLLTLYQSVTGSGDPGLKVNDLKRYLLSSADQEQQGLVDDLFELVLQIHEALHGMTIGQNSLSQTQKEHAIYNLGAWGYALPFFACIHRAFIRSEAVDAMAVEITTALEALRRCQDPRDYTPLIQITRNLSEIFNDQSEMAAGANPKKTAAVRDALGNVWLGWHGKDGTSAAFAKVVFTPTENEFLPDFAAYWKSPGFITFENQAFFCTVTIPPFYDPASVWAQWPERLASRAVYSDGNAFSIRQWDVFDNTVRAQYRKAGRTVRTMKFDVDGEMIPETMLDPLVAAAKEVRDGDVSRAWSDLLKAYSGETPGSGDENLYLAIAQLGREVLDFQPDYLLKQLIFLAVNSRDGRLIPLVYWITTHAHAYWDDWNMLIIKSLLEDVLLDPKYFSELSHVPWQAKQPDLLWRSFQAQGGRLHDYLGVSLAELRRPLDAEKIQEISEQFYLLERVKDLLPGLGAEILKNLYSRSNLPDVIRYLRSDPVERYYETYTNNVRGVQNALYRETAVWEADPVYYLAKDVAHAGWEQAFEAECKEPEALLSLTNVLAARLELPWTFVSVHWLYYQGFGYEALTDCSKDIENMTISEQIDIFDQMKDSLGYDSTVVKIWNSRRMILGYIQLLIKMDKSRTTFYGDKLGIPLSIALEATKYLKEFEMEYQIVHETNQALMKEASVAESSLEAMDPVADETTLVAPATEHLRTIFTEEREQADNLTSALRSLYFCAVVPGPSVFTRLVAWRHYWRIRQLINEKWPELAYELVREAEEEVYFVDGFGAALKTVVLLTEARHSNVWEMVRSEAFNLADQLNLSLEKEGVTLPLDFGHLLRGYKQSSWVGQHKMDWDGDGLRLKEPSHVLLRQKLYVIMVRKHWEKEKELWQQLHEESVEAVVDNSNKLPPAPDDEGRSQETMKAYLPGVISLVACLVDAESAVYFMLAELIYFLVTTNASPAERMQSGVALDQHALSNINSERLSSRKRVWLQLSATALLPQGKGIKPRDQALERAFLCAA